MLQNIVNNYERLRLNLGALIDKSGYRNSFLAEKIGMQPAYFSIRKQKATWTETEIKKILEIIEDEDLQEFYDIELIKNSITDNPLNSKEFEKKMKW